MIPHALYASCVIVCATRATEANDIFPLTRWRPANCLMCVWIVGLHAQPILSLYRIPCKTSFVGSTATHILPGLSHGMVFVTDDILVAQYSIATHIPPSLSSVPMLISEMIDVILVDNYSRWTVLLVELSSTHNMCTDSIQEVREFQIVSDPCCVRFKFDVSFANWDWWCTIRRTQ